MARRGYSPWHRIARDRPEPGTVRRPSRRHLAKVAIAPRHADLRNLNGM